MLSDFAKELVKELVMQSRDEMNFTLTALEVADLLGIGRTKVYHLFNNGKIPGAKKVEGQWIVPRDTFLTWFYSKEVENESKSIEKRIS